MYKGLYNPQIIMRLILVTSLLFFSTISHCQDFAGVEKFSKGIIKALSKNGDVSKYVLTEKLALEIINSEIDRISSKLDDDKGLITEAKESALQEFKLSSGKLVKTTKDNFEKSELDLTAYTYDYSQFNVANESGSNIVTGNIQIVLKSNDEQSFYSLKLKEAIWFENKWYLSAPILFNQKFDRDLICECINGRDDFECEKAKEEFEAFLEEDKDAAMALIEEIMETCDMSSSEAEAAEKTAVEAREEAMEEATDTIVVQDIYEFLSEIEGNSYSRSDINEAFKNLEDMFPDYCNCGQEISSISVSPDCKSEVEDMLGYIGQFSKKQQTLYLKLIEFDCQH